MHATSAILNTHIYTYTYILNTYMQSYYPRANLSKIIARSPKILLQSSKQVQEDAIEVGDRGSGWQKMDTP